MVEIDHGPYLVKPVEEAFDNGERPINIDASNVVWLNSDKSNWIDPKSKAEVSFLWESNDDKGMKGLFVKLPKGFDGQIESSGTTFHAVVIGGELSYKMPQTMVTKVLDAGSYFSSTDEALHRISNHSEGEVVIYVRTNGALYISA